MSEAHKTPSGNRIWRFGPAEYDEQRRELRVDGQLRSVEAKPLHVLFELLCRAGETVTREELLAAVWRPNTVPQSLTTAIAKLRGALGDQGRDLIESVHGFGYRIGVPVELSAGPEKPRLAFGFKPGDQVPNRPQWCLDRLLGSEAAQDVWLARHAKTGEQRVFKFADTAERLTALRREAALSRILHETLGDRPDLVRVIEWNFDIRPFYIESAYGGLDLPAWAAAQGGLAAIPLPDRITLVARIARTVAAAHGVGVLHRDIKPSNILVSGAGAETTIRLVDFGSGRLTEAARQAAVTITGLGLTAVAAQQGERLSGTLRYMAREVLAGGPPTIAADVYALGVLLYQIVVGDLDRLPGAGWEEDVADPLLREDIKAAAANDVGRRLLSAAMLAERLEHIEQRHLDRNRQEQQEQRSKQFALKVERDRLRKPWLLLAFACLFLGVLGTSSSAIRAARARDEAQRQSANVKAINQFLTDDLLGRGNPAISGNHNETLMEAAEAAESMIEQRLANQPKLAASIYITLAKAFDGRSAFAASRKAYDRAQAILIETEGVGSADVVILQLRRAGMEAIAHQPGSLDLANSMIATNAPLVDRLGTRRLEATAWLLWAKGQFQIMKGDMRESSLDFSGAEHIAATLPDAFDPQIRFMMKDNEGFALWKLGHWTEATTVLSQLVNEETALHGPLHPNTLTAAFNLAEVSLLDGHPELTLRTMETLYPAIRTVFGPANRKTFAAWGARVIASELLGHYDEAARDALEASKEAATAMGKTSYDSVGMLSAAGESECRGGHADDGLKKANEAYDVIRNTLGEKHPIAQSIRATVAECLALDNRASEAKALLNDIDCVSLGGLIAQPETCADTGIILAAAARSTGDLGEARRLTTDALGHIAAQPADPFFRKWGEKILVSLPPEKPR